MDYLDAWERPDTSVIGVSGTFSRMSAQSHPGVCHMVRSHRVRANLAGVGAAQHCRPSVSGAGTRQHFDRATAASSVPREAGTWPWKPCPVYEQLENFLKISLNYSPKKHILCAKKTIQNISNNAFFVLCRRPPPQPYPVSRAKAVAEGNCAQRLPCANRRVGRNGDAGDRRSIPEMAGPEQPASCWRCAHSPRSGG